MYASLDAVEEDEETYHIVWKPINADEFTVEDAGGTDDTSYLRAGEWTAAFSYGTIKGMAKCSGQTGTNNNWTWSNPSATTNESELTSASGDKQYCWCAIIAYTKSGNSQCDLLTPLWVFDEDGGAAYNCMDRCAVDCANDAGVSADLRRALFGIN